MGMGLVSLPQERFLESYVKFKGFVKLVPNTTGVTSKIHIHPLVYQNPIFVYKECAPNY